MWPSEDILPNVSDFKNTAMEYYAQVASLAKDILRVLALTLDLEENYFNDFASGPVAKMRLVHYPPQPPDSPAKLTRGIGAHTDFGCITILLQDKVAGLQVYEYPTKQWLDVTPTPGAFVVNLGSLMMRWSNGKYGSNLHRVTNVSGAERYSIPVFFEGTPDHVVECLPNCVKEGETPKWPPITVEEANLEGYRESYGRAERFMKDAEGKAESDGVAQTTVRKLAHT
jgi:isopenicillin N synthase-like dioxygenase